MADEYDEYYRYMEEYNSSQHNAEKEKDIDINTCISCSGTNLQYDRSSGTIVCASCGVVNTESFIDYSAEWNYGGGDEPRGKDPSRCGCPINPLLENSSLSTVIGKGGGQKYWLMKKIHQQNCRVLWK